MGNCGSGKDYDKKKEENNSKARAYEDKGKANQGAPGNQN